VGRAGFRDGEERLSERRSKSGRRIAVPLARARFTPQAASRPFKLTRKGLRGDMVVLAGARERSETVAVRSGAPGEEREKTGE